MKIIQLYPDDAEKTFLQASILLRPKGKTITEANITNPNAASLHCVPTIQNGSTSGKKIRACNFNISCKDREAAKKDLQTKELIDIQLGPHGARI